MGRLTSLDMLANLVTEDHSRLSLMLVLQELLLDPEFSVHSKAQLMEVSTFLIILVVSQVPPKLIKRRKSHMTLMFTEEGFSDSTFRITLMALKLKMRKTELLS